MKIGIDALDHLLEKKIQTPFDDSSTKKETEFAAEMGFWEPKVFDLVTHKNISEVINYLLLMKQSGFIVPNKDHDHVDWKTLDLTGLKISVDNKYDLYARFHFTTNRPFYRFLSGRAGLTFELDPAEHNEMVIIIDRDPWLNNVSVIECHCYISLGETLRGIPYVKNNDLKEIPIQTINKLFDF